MLEVKVNEVCHASETIEEIIKFVLTEINKWNQSEDETPLTFTITKNITRGSPLNIKIVEKQKTNEALA